MPMNNFSALCCPDGAALCTRFSWSVLASSGCFCSDQGVLWLLCCLPPFIPEAHFCVALRPCPTFVRSSLLLGPAELSTFLTCLSACSAAASAGVADSSAAHTAVAFCICCVNAFSGNEIQLYNLRLDLCLLAPFGPLSWLHRSKTGESLGSERPAQR